MFDLDGTLADTMQADEECFVGALSDVFGFENINTDWSSYCHATDSGILVELFESRLDRAPRPGEIERFQSQFIARLETASRNAGRFGILPGAQVLLNELAAREVFGVALATGGWKIAAQWKLKIAGLNFSFEASAFADDDCSREGIMRCAWQRALKHYGRTRFDAVTYVGDGTWDVRASKNLGYNFIGIGSGAKAAKLHSAGVTTIFSDYSNTHSFIKALESIVGQN